MNIVIMGCGRVGAALAEDLSAEGNAVTIMDVDSDAFRRLPPNFPGAAIVGNGIDDQALRLAKIEAADVFIAVTQGDNRNLMAAQVAKHVFHVPRVIARVYDRSRAAIFNELGLETISSTSVIRSLIAAKVNDGTDLASGRSTVSGEA